MATVNEISSELPSRGLTSEEAHQRLLAHGPNAVSEEKPRLLRTLLGKFWAPVPWMLEATIILELALENLSKPVSLRSCSPSTRR